MQGYLKLAAQGKYQEALALIKKDNPFPAVCGRVCNKRCEEACTRGTIDQAVAIDAVKKFLAETDRLGPEDRHHRRRPRGPVRRVLSGHPRLQAHGL